MFESRIEVKKFDCWKGHIGVHWGKTLGDRGVNPWRTNLGLREWTRSVKRNDERFSWTVEVHNREGHVISRAVIIHDKHWSIPLYHGQKEQGMWLLRTGHGAGGAVPTLYSNKDYNAPRFWTTSYHGKSLSNCFASSVVAWIKKFESQKFFREFFRTQNQCNYARSDATLRAWLVA